jgi:hypothetical protein
MGLLIRVTVGLNRLTHKRISERIKKQRGGKK